MNIKEAMRHANREFVLIKWPNILVKEILRLREQRKVLYDLIPDGIGVPFSIWQEIHEEETKEMNIVKDEIECLVAISVKEEKGKTEMTADEAIGNIEKLEKLGSYVSKEVTALLTEVKRLRKVKCLKKQVTDERNDEINRLQELRKNLHEVIDRRNERISELKTSLKSVNKEWEKNRKNLGEDVRKVLKDYAV